MMHALKLAGWIFELGLFGLLVTTLIYARRLDHSISRMRADRAAFRALIEQIGASIDAAISATDRLKEQASTSALALDEACQTAAVSAGRLDDLISQATLIVNRPAPIVRNESGASPAVASAALVATTELEGTGYPVSMLVRSCKSSRTTRSVASRRSQKPQSRAERDLARILLDAS